MAQPSATSASTPETVADGLQRYQIYRAFFGTKRSPQRLKAGVASTSEVRHGPT
jgi:hypothetical protein